MHPDEAALFAAICDAPDDDAPRLIYADWLDEHGDPERAEFIRIQCRLAEFQRLVEQRSLDTSLAARGINELDPREQELLGAHARRWFDGPWFNESWDRVFITSERMCAVTHRDSDGRELDWPTRLLFEFHRGFVERIEVSVDDFVQFAQDLLAIAPLKVVQQFDSYIHWRGYKLSKTEVPKTATASEVLRLLADEWPQIEFQFPD